jgi:hypothetical protein
MFQPYRPGSSRRPVASALIASHPNRELVALLAILSKNHLPPGLD